MEIGEQKEDNLNFDHERSSLAKEDQGTAGH